MKQRKLIIDFILDNCSTLKVHGMFYNVYNDNWSWCSRTDISYALHAIKNVIEDDKEIYHE